MQHLDQAEVLDLIVVVEMEAVKMVVEEVMVEMDQHIV